MTDRELAGLLECLAWYANADNYYAQPGQGNPVRDDMGNRARHALEDWSRRTPSSEGDGRDAEDARAWRQWCESVGAEQIVALNEKLGGALGLVRDAERYRWLRHATLLSSPAPVITKGVYLDGRHIGNESLWGAVADAAIDAAIAAAAGGGDPFRRA